MDKPTYTITFDFDNPNTELVFNQPSGKLQFPKRLYGETAFEILLQMSKGNNAFDLTNMTSATAYVKVTNSIFLPVLISTGATTVNAGEVEFIIEKDVIPNSYSLYTIPGNNYPITLYIVIESSDASKISLETQIQIMDIDRDGSEEVVELDGATIAYTPEQSAKWTLQYTDVPVSVSGALDQLARVVRTDYGTVIDGIATPDVTPADGEKWLVIATGTGVFVGKENSLMEWNDELADYIEHTPNEGDEIYNVASDKRLRYNGSAWVEAVDHAISKATITTATVATGDKVLIQDVSASNALKTVTAQAVANLKVTELSEDTSPQLGGDLSANGNMIQQSIGANIASAGTLTIVTDGNSFTVTGTTTITEFSAVAVGTQITLYFSGVLTLTHHATNLILPTSANITTAVGDFAVFEEYASGDWICVDYFRKNGIPLEGTLLQYRNIVIPANAFSPAITNGARIVQVEKTTNKNNFDAYDFDASTVQYIHVNIPFPDDWDLSTIKAKFHWTDGDTAGTGDVIWGIQGVACSNDDALDVAYGTAQEVTDTFIATGDNHVTSATGACTIGGTPVLDDLIQLRVYRDASDGSDTYTQKARLIAVSLQYRTKSTINTAW